MVTHGHPHDPAAPTAPSSPPPPQWQALNWSFPFAPVSGNAADPQTWLAALSRADGGFYPLGSNGMFHGGIHFDAGTGGQLKQGDGVRAIAEGEVVAYRLDSTYAELTYPTAPPGHALYSTGFVLIRHRLVLPPASEAAGSPAISPGASSTAAAPVGASDAHPPQTYQPPADDVLEFYSLYMHQLDWKGYQKAQADGGTESTQAVHPLPFWLGDRHFRVGAKANDHQRQPPQLNTPLNFRQPSGGLVAALGDGALLGSVASGPTTESVDAYSRYHDQVRFTVPPANPADAAANAASPATGVHICDRASGSIIGLLPRGGEFSVTGNGAKGWAQIATITKGKVVAALAGGTTDPRAVTGWVNLDGLDAVIYPNPLDTVVVLNTPYKVGAGDVVGYLGEYQNLSESSPLPPKPKRALLHVEVFTGAPIDGFIARSRKRAKERTDGKTLLVIQRGAKLVQPSDSQSNTRLAGLTLVPVKGDPGKGVWAKVQPTRVAAQSGAHGQGHSHHASGTPLGNPLWVERNYAGTVAGPTIQTWTDFPLQLVNAQGSALGYQLVLSRTQLDQPGAISKAMDDQDRGGTQWWSVVAGDDSGWTINGWVCEKPDTQWQSPWAWPGFDTVDTTAIPVADMLRRNLFEAKQLFDDEEKEFSPVAATVNAGPFIGKLERAARRQGSGTGNVVPDDLKKALTVPWLAKAVSQVIVRYESEWGGDMGKWEALSRLMGDASYVWQTELERIRKLQWWDKVKAVEGFPASPDVWHIHPIGLVGNFTASMAAITLEEARIRAFLRMIRTGEGTHGLDSYERLFGGQSFIKDYSRDFSDHPHVMVTRTIRGRSITSSAAGAYQVMGYNWDGEDSKRYRQKANIIDFSPISQDRYSVALLVFKRHALDAIKQGNMESAIFEHQCNLEWASLPGDRYNQGGVTMQSVNQNFEKYVNEELAGRTELAVPIGGLDDLIK